MATSKAPNSYHTFHIPVMGTGHSLDTPIRVAPMGISSVISLVDDIMMEDVRKYYCEKFDISYLPVEPKAKDGRARRITAYLNTVQAIVHKEISRIKALPFYKDNDKKKYFELLPHNIPVKSKFVELQSMQPGPERSKLEEELTAAIIPGEINVNIMVKLDRQYYDQNGTNLPDQFSDAKAALRGFAQSKLDASIIFSAGINQRLFTYMTNFKDFYRSNTGYIKKRIILKVSDFRSSLTQGRFLAKKGLEVHEFRIESGLNCGGHAFPSQGYLLPALLQEFKEKRHELQSVFTPLVKKYYTSNGLKTPADTDIKEPFLTVQGGIGTHGEAQRLINDFGMDTTGWASPFLLVPEATGVDNFTRQLLIKAGEKDLYTSDASPLNIPFNNVKGSKSQSWTEKRFSEGNPGSPCRKGYLVSNSEFTNKPVCLASKRYQEKKLASIVSSSLPSRQKAELIRQLAVKSCICDQLGNGLLISLGLAKPEKAPSCICPGPNLAWFDKTYSLKEMVNHIYGRIPSLVPNHRIHMFAKEMEMYVDYFKRQANNCTLNPKKVMAGLESFRTNLLKGIALCKEIASQPAYENENLTSIMDYADTQTMRLNKIYAEFKEKIEADAAIPA